jgi:hypothetical protein
MFELRVFFRETELNTIYLSQLNKLVNNNKDIDAILLYKTNKNQSSPAERNHA